MYNRLCKLNTFKTKLLISTCIPLTINSFPWLPHFSIQYQFSLSYQCTNPQSHHLFLCFPHIHIIHIQSFIKSTESSKYIQSMTIYHNFYLDFPNSSHLHLLPGRSHSLNSSMISMDCKSDSFTLNF